MKKLSHGILVLWILIAAIVAGGTFLLFRHLGAGIDTTSGNSAALAVQPNDDVQQNDSASGTPGVTVAMQEFSNDGYSFSVPASWNIEHTGADAVAVHPDAASLEAVCKIEVSAFPYSPDSDMADWIVHRIGADPSVAVVERSSEDVSLDGGAGVKWIGTIDGIPTTLVYAFNSTHAYEIAPSVVGEDASGNAQCNGILQEFLSALTI